MVQVLPADDFFAYGTPNYGSFVSLYMGARLTNTSSGTAAPSNYRPGYLHSAYQGVDTGTGLVVTPAAASYDSDSVTNDLRGPRGFVWRAPLANADVTVGGTFKVSSIAGAANATHLSQFGVMGRVINGTTTGADRAIHILTPDCYALTVHYVSFTVVFALVRFNAGTRTVLASSTISGGTLAQVPVTTPLAIQLDIRTIAGDVSLSGSFTGWSTNGPISLSATDSSGSKITSAGRAGFVMGRERDYGAVDVVDLCDRFTAEEDGVLTIHDLFERYQANSMAESLPTDLFGNTGRSLQQAYGWDHFTSGNTRELGRLTSAERALVATDGSDPADNFRAYISSRKSTQLVAQRRSVICNMATAPTNGELWMGIGLRMTQATPIQDGTSTFPGATGYYAYFQYRGPSAADDRWIIFRGLSASQIQPLASIDDPLGTYFPGVGSDFQMDFEAYTRESGTINGPVVLKLRVDGVQLPLVLFGTPAGVTVDASGTVVDSNANRIAPTYGEALLTWKESPSDSVNLIFDEWREQSLVNALVPDNDQASVDVPGEPDAVGTLDGVMQAEYEWREETDTFTNVFRPDSGHRLSMPRFQSAADVPFTRSRWFIVSRSVQAAELSALRAFYDAHSGVEIPFLFTNPATQVVEKGYFAQDSLDWVKDNVGTYSVSFEVGENY